MGLVTGSPPAKTSSLPGRPSLMPALLPIAPWLRWRVRRSTALAFEMADKRTYVAKVI